MFYTYLLQNEKGWIYTGQTQNLMRRFRDHQNGTGTIFTKNHGPWRIVYYETYTTRKQAMKREKALKNGVGKTAVRNAIKEHQLGNHATISYPENSDMLFAMLI